MCLDKGDTRNQLAIFFSDSINQSWENLADSSSIDSHVPLIS